MKRFKSWVALMPASPYSKGATPLHEVVVCADKESAETYVAGFGGGRVVQVSEVERGVETILQIARRIVAMDGSYDGLLFNSLRTSLERIDKARKKK